MLTYFSKKVKLTVDDMEREVHGGELDAAERLLWRRWVENENARQVRKSRVQVTCCGRFRYRYQIEQDEHGNWWCDACWNAVPMCRPPPAADPAHEEATLPAPDRKEDAVEVVDESPESPRVPPGDAAAGSAPEKSSRREDWRWETGKRATKRRRHALTGAVDFWNQHHGYGYSDGAKRVPHSDVYPIFNDLAIFLCGFFCGPRLGSFRYTSL